MKPIILLLLFISISCEDYIFKGIDISTYQKTVNWDTVAENNHFVIIRAGYGLGHIDKMYETHYANAKSHGLKVGAYWFAYATSRSVAQQEANYAVQALQGKQFEWPIYYDIEDKSIFNKKAQNDIAKAFCEILEANKFYCGIYSGASHLNHNFDDEVKSKFTIWVAHWDVDKPKYDGKHGVWQYTVGSEPGVSGRCDKDKGAIDFEPIMKENGLNGF